MFKKMEPDGKIKKEDQKEAQKAQQEEAPQKEAGTVQAEAPLSEAYEKAKQETEEWRTRYLYLRAEFENFKKRMDRERSEWLKFGNVELVRALLPVIDHLEQALLHGRNDPETLKAVFEGIELTLHQMKEMMKRFGISPFESVGKPFDPRFHEAIARELKSDVAPNTVTSQLRKGYLMHEKLLRPAQVTVAQAPASEKKEKHPPQEEYCSKKDCEHEEEEKT